MKPNSTSYIEKLKTRGLYSSFKVTVADDSCEDVWKSDFWPENIRVRKFVHNFRSRTAPGKRPERFKRS